MNINDVMTPDPACCVKSDSAQKAAILMRELNVGCVPIVDSEESHLLVGIVTDRDLCLQVLAAGKDAKNTSLAECMTGELVTCLPSDDIESVAHKMQQNQIRRIPVIDDRGHLEGIVSTADIVLCGDLPSEEIDETMRDISEPNIEEFQQLSSIGMEPPTPDMGTGR